MKMSFQVKDRVTALPVVGLNVSLKRHSDNTVITSVNSDANGFVTFTLNGHPGDVFAEVTQGGETRRYSSRTTAPSGTFQVGEAGEITQGLGVGVVDGVANNLVVSPGSGLSVSVGTGLALLADHQSRYYTATTLALAAANVTNARIDLVVVRATRATGVSELAVIAGTPAATPVVPVVTQNTVTWEEALAQVRVEANATTMSADKITDVRRYVTAKIAPLSVVTASLADSAVTNAKIANLAITTTKLQEGSVTTTKILDGHVTTAKLAADSVTTDKIAAGAVGTLDLADLGVTEGKIANSSVTSSKIGFQAVTIAKIADLAVTEVKIADLAVTEAKLATAVQTKLNAAGGAIVKGTSAVRDGATSNNIGVTTGSSVMTASITIPSDGRTYDLIASGQLQFYNGTGYTATELRISALSQVSGWVGAAAGIQANPAHSLVVLAAAAGTHSVQMFMKVNAGSADYTGGRVDVHAVPR